MPKIEHFKIEIKFKNRLKVELKIDSQINFYTVSELKLLKNNFFFTKKLEIQDKDLDLN